MLPYINWKDGGLLSLTDGDSSSPGSTRSDNCCQGVMVCSDSLWCIDENEVVCIHNTLRVYFRKDTTMDILKLLDSIPVWFGFSLSDNAEVRKILRQTDAEALASDWKAVAEDFEMVLKGKSYGTK